MKEIPKLYMQIATLIFGATISVSSVYAAWNISDMLSSIANEMDWVHAYLADISKNHETLGDIYTALLDLQK